MVDSLLFYFVIFTIYSFVGWCMEMVVCYYETKTWVNRGFLLGPICPIYGCGCIIITLLLKRYLNDPVVLFVMAVTFCSILEYFTSYIMEKIFKARWWDYSDKKYNLNGRICLENSVAFGVLGLLLSYVINPFVVEVLGMIPNYILNIIASVIFVLFVVDNAVSFKVISGFTKVAKTIKKDSTEEITKKVRDILTKQGYLYRRLVSAFDFKASEKLLQNIKDKVKYETLKAKRMFVEKLSMSGQNEEKIKTNSKKRIKVLKDKIKIEKEITREKLKKIK